IVSELKQCCQNGLYRCERCNFSTKDVGTIVQHIHRHNEIQYKCPKCKHVSYTSGEFQKHLLVHSGKFSCQFCDYRAPRKDYIIRHMNSAHSKEKKKWRVKAENSKTLMNSSPGLKLLLTKNPTLEETHNGLTVLMVKNKISIPPNCTTKVMGFKMVDGKKHLVLKKNGDEQPSHPVRTEESRILTFSEAKNNNDQFPLLEVSATAANIGPANEKSLLKSSMEEASEIKGATSFAAFANALKPTVTQQEQRCIALEEMHSPTDCEENITIDSESNSGLNSSSEKVFSFHNYSKDTSSFSSDVSLPIEDQSYSELLTDGPEPNSSKIASLADSNRTPDDSSMASVQDCHNDEIPEQLLLNSDPLMEKVPDSEIEVDECIATVEEESNGLNNFPGLACRPDATLKSTSQREGKQSLLLVRLPQPRSNHQLAKRKKKRKSHSQDPSEPLAKSKRHSSKKNKEKDAFPDVVNWKPVPKDVERTLRLSPFCPSQLIKCPRRNQPVIVLNHPDVDIPEVTNIMRTVGRYKGEVLKVALSQRTVDALSELSCNPFKRSHSVPDNSSHGRHSRRENTARERFILKLKLKKTSRNKYQVVNTTSDSTERSSSFSCWFCGRIFDNQEEWIGHGQRHLMEATRDWNKLF
uniref:C2H2-type domain-containing protein n=1 Tax=Paramormyrops kingsleyae TaxID=1676925 RepID=A0A3B3T3I0_9TELE